MGRHLIALAFIALVLVSALDPLPPLVDAVTGSPAGDARLALPFGYVLLAPLSNVLDALTFLSAQRARALVIAWLTGLLLAGALLPGTWRRRLARALGLPFAFLLLAAAAVLLPRPVPRLVTGDRDATIVDYHAHTAASHDGRKGFGYDDLARWHARQGFEASYVTDHNVPFTGSTGGFPLLPGVEWSVYRLHVVAIGPVQEIARDSFQGSAERMLGLFAELHRQGALGIASIPEYWDNYRSELDRLVTAGVDGFEIVNCAPKAIDLPSSGRAEVVALAARHDLLVTGASDNHGWGRVTCVWNLAHPGEHGLAANHVLARPVALAQGNEAAWSAALTQPWLMLRSLSIPERVSWLVWIALVTIYRSLPSRGDQARGLGVLARSLSVAWSRRRGI